MKAFDPNYKRLDEMYQDNYYPTFLVDKVKDELQTVSYTHLLRMQSFFWQSGSTLPLPDEFAVRMM